MVRHIVMWRLRDGRPSGAGAESYRAIRERLHSLVSAVPTLRDLRFEADFTDDPGAFDVVLETTFDDRAGLEAYRVHPAHQEVAGFIRERITDRAVVDYEA